MNDKSTNISLAGINRNIPTVNTLPGTCNELINIRFKDNSWRSVGDKVVLYDLDNSAQWLYTEDVVHLYRHPAADKNLLCGIITHKYTGNTRLVIIDLVTGVLVQSLATITAASYLQLTHLGNVLILCLDDTRRTYLYRQDEEIYIELPEPIMPQLFYSRTVEYRSSSSFPAVKTLSEALGDYYKLLDEKAEQNILTGHMMFVVVYRLYDGSCIKHTSPYYLPLSYFRNDNDGMERMLTLSKAQGNSVDLYSFRHLVFSKFITMHYQLTEQDAESLGRYKGIIQDVQIYAAWVQNHFALTDDEEKDYEIVSNYELRPIKYNEQLSSFAETPSFHRVKSMSLEDFIKKPGAWNQVDGFDFHALETKPRLPADDFSNHVTWGDVSTIYNNRIHYGRVTTRFGKSSDVLENFANFQKFQHIQQGLSGQLYDNINKEMSRQIYSYRFFLEVTIKTNTGSYIVRNRFFPAVWIEVTGNPPVIKRYIFAQSYVSYPDIRAEKIRVLVNNDHTSDNLHELASYELKPHPYLNLAYNAETNLQSMWLFNNDNKRLNIPGLTTIPQPDIKALLYEPDRVQVSGQTNPFVFPSANSYRFDNARVMAVASVAEAISEGQYGQFPLYVLTNSGTFLLAQGNNNVLYSQQLPLNKEITISDKVMSVSGGVIYIAKDGLKLITSNREVKEVSKDIKGAPDAFLGDLIAFQDVAGAMLPHTSSVDFLDYLSNNRTIFGYDFKHNELIVTNDSHLYSYVFSLATGTWHKITHKFSLIYLDYPNYHGFTAEGVNLKGKIYDLSAEVKNKNKCLIITRPFALNTNTMAFKRIERVIARLLITSIAIPGHFQLFASNDMIHWYLVNHVVFNPLHVSSVLMQRANSSARYYCIVLSYVSSEADYLSHIELSYSERFDGKLR